MARILLADDDSDLRFLNEMVLSEAGYDVTTVANGLEATSAAQEPVPEDVVGPTPRSQTRMRTTSGRSTSANSTLVRDGNSS